VRGAGRGTRFLDDRLMGEEIEGKVALVTRGPAGPKRRVTGLIIADPLSKTQSIDRVATRVPGGTTAAGPSVAETAVLLRLHPRGKIPGEETSRSTGAWQRPGGLN
jgi:hypothetical protein